MNILSPVTDNCSSWISGRGRMTVEMFSWPSLHERMCQTWGSNSGPLACKANSLPIRSKFIKKVRKQSYWRSTASTEWQIRTQLSESFKGKWDQCTLKDLLMIDGQHMSTRYLSRQTYFSWQIVLFPKDQHQLWYEHRKCVVADWESCPCPFLTHLVHECHHSEQILNSAMAGLNLKMMQFTFD